MLLLTLSISGLILTGSNLLGYLRYHNIDDIDETNSIDDKRNFSEPSCHSLSSDQVPSRKQYGWCGQCLCAAEGVAG